MPAPHPKQLSPSAIRVEVGAGVTTFLTMAYIIFVQPAVLSGRMVGIETGMDFGAVTSATCLAAAVATMIMGLYARYPIALAPGMGQNFFFVTTAIPVAAAAGAKDPWQTALAAVFLAGLTFLAISMLGVRERLMDVVSPSLKHAIAVGIGLFIAFVGLRNAQFVVSDPATGVRLAPDLMTPAAGIFVTGFVFTAGLHARRVRGAILWGIMASFTVAAVVNPEAVRPEGIASLPPSLVPTLFKLDIAGALTAAMIPVVVMFLFMDVFDTMGTLIGVTEQAGLTVDGKLPRVERALMADAFGTVTGAALGTSTVTSYIESAAGVEYGGRTGLTALTVALLFLVALFFFPLIDSIGGYPPVTAPALVFVGAMMTENVVRIDWQDPTEAVPAFVTALGIPLFSSIGDGLAMGLCLYPVVKTLAGRPREVTGMMWGLSGLLIVYFVFVRTTS